MDKKVDAIMWFRRDLRMDDNHALFRALTDKKSVLPLFIFDQRILDKLPQDDARVTFIWDALHSMDKVMRAHDSALHIKYGLPEDVLKKLLEKYPEADIYTNEDYEPYARKRDQMAKKIVEAGGGNFYAFKDHVLHAPGEILKDDKTPYSIYTPYSKKALKRIHDEPVYGEFEIGESLLKNLVRGDGSEMSLSDIGFVKSSVQIPRVDVDRNFLERYKDVRDTPSDDRGTSRVGVHLRFGTMSVRALARQASEVSDNTFLKELLWRDFFQAILYYYPQTPHISFKVCYDDVPWRTGERADQDFAAWCGGVTGYPIVDAGMRELNATGHMHNRVRMVVASFLCKHLLLDWRRGERYFACKLLDYELASNVGNWQWAMGGGCDAAPYFRVFNPYTQQKKFDADSEYIRKWIPEYGTDAYPQAIIEHTDARERALSVYKNALGKKETSK